MDIVIINRCLRNGVRKSASTIIGETKMTNKERDGTVEEATPGRHANESLLHVYGIITPPSPSPPPLQSSSYSPVLSLSSSPFSSLPPSFSLTLLSSPPLPFSSFLVGLFFFLLFSLSYFFSPFLLFFSSRFHFIFFFLPLLCPLPPFPLLFPILLYCYPFFLLLISSFLVCHSLFLSSNSHITLFISPLPPFPPPLLLLLQLRFRTSSKEDRKVERLEEEG